MRACVYVCERQGERRLLLNACLRERERKRGRERKRERESERERE